MKFHPSALKRKLFFIFLDFCIICVSVYGAFLLRFDFEIPHRYTDAIYLSILFLTFSRISLYNYFRIYDISWRHFGFKDMIVLVYASIFSTLALLVFAYGLHGSEYIIPRSIIPIEFFISLFLILALRVSRRFYLEPNRVKPEHKNTIIIADLDRANIILRTINNSSSDYNPVAIINEQEKNLKVNGIDVYSLEMFQRTNIKSSIAIIDEKVNVAGLYEKLLSLNFQTIRIASDYNDYGAEIKNISVEDLLARRPQDLDKKKIESFIKNKIILITGAGGSIGSEICRQCEVFGAKKLILLDNNEYNLYSITEEITKIEKVSIMQSVVDKELIERTFAKYNPQIVIHAAAYKHVPLVEENMHEAIVNNIMGTKNIIDLSIAHNVERLVMISTDKAVRPTNVMGTTKRICELYAQNVNEVSLENSKRETTEIVTVRFGNVLGSSGSVIPKFKAQIEAGKNITVTHPDITRYFMLVSEACELVLQAGAIGSGGEIFILDMGEPVKIVDLAKKMIELSAKPNIKIEFSGLRPGEKLYEELLIDASDTKTEYPSITVAKSTKYDLAKLNADILELIQTEDKIVKLKQIVPEFKHMKNI